MTEPDTTDRSTRLRDPERTRADVLAVATEVFADSGYSGARIDAGTPAAA